MSVYIASMNMRGIRAKPLCPENLLVINATSAQAKNHVDRLTFSPMTPINGGYKGFWNFESYWQSGKVWEGIDHKKTVKWWKSQKVPRRRLLNSKGLKVLHAKFNGIKYDYVSSRKNVYVLEYYRLIKQRSRLLELRNLVKSGKNIVVYDFDGPRDKLGNPICLKVDRKMLTKKINDTQYPFGHGYIVAGLLAGIRPKSYIA